MLKKRLLIGGILVVFMLAMCGCDGDDIDDVDDPESSMANPVHKVDETGLIDITGFSPVAPDGATDIEYEWIEVAGAEPIAEMEFDYKGRDYSYRMQATKYTDIQANINGDTDKSLYDAVCDCTNVGAALSGEYEKWTEVNTSTVAHCDAIYAIEKNDGGYIAWIDTVSGVMYCLEGDDNISANELKAMAELIFVPIEAEE